MDKEQELRPCPFCGKAAHVSYPDSPSHLMEIGCPDNWGFKRGAHGHCNVAPAATGMTFAETAERWNRRSSDEQAEVVGWPIDTEDQVEALAKECGWNNRRYMTPKDYAIWCGQMRQFAKLASPPSVAAGGVTEERVEALARKLDPMIFGPNYTGRTKDIARAALTAALAVGDEGIREGEPNAR